MKRSLSPKAKRSPQLSAKHPSKSIGDIATHSDLAKLIPKFGAQLEKSPHFAAMAMTDPVRALQFVGYNLSPEIVRHIRATVPYLFGSSKAFRRAVHSTSGLPWIKGVRFVEKPKAPAHARLAAKARRSK